MPAGARTAVALAFCACALAHPARADTQEAFAAMKAGRYLEAAAELQAVVDRSPGYADGFFLLGHCMLRMGRIHEAEVDFRRALRLDPTPAAYYDGLALALAAAGNWPHAIRAASEGLARAGDPKARYTLLAFRGYALSALRRWGDAINDFEAARLIRQEPWVLAMLGRARFATGAYAEAVIPLRQVLPVAPEDRVVLRLLSESFLRLAAAEADPVRKRSDYIEALKYAQRLAYLTPSDVAAVHLVGRAALGAGSLGHAESVFRHVLQMNPRHCYAMANLGRTFIAAERLAEAEAYLHNAVTCAPRMTAVWESLGEVYQALGRTKDAEAAFRRVEEIEPSQAASEFPATIPAFQPR